MLANELHTPAAKTHVKHYTVQQASKQVQKIKPTLLKLQPGSADDLQAIKGIGPVVETALKAAGIHTYRQIACFTQGNIDWVNQHLDFHGRIEREDWIGQGKTPYTD